jgi:hypothetical protein
VHHDPGQVDAIIGAAVVVLVLTVVAFVIHPWVRGRFFAGPRLDKWQEARRRLSRADQWRVIWQTRRNYPASRVALADAQLAYARYLQDAAERSPWLRWRWLRVGLPAYFGVLAVFAAGGTITQGQSSQERLTDTVLAAGFAMSALTGALVPRSMRRLIKRMARLLQEIEDRHAQVSGQ